MHHISKAIGMHVIAWGKQKQRFVLEEKIILLSSLSRVHSIFVPEDACYGCKMQSNGYTHAATSCRLIRDSNCPKSNSFMLLSFTDKTAPDAMPHSITRWGDLSGVMSEWSTSPPHATDRIFGVVYTNCDKKVSEEEEEERIENACP